MKVNDENVNITNISKTEAPKSKFFNKNIPKVSGLKFGMMRIKLKLFPSPTRLMLWHP
jgi:hypothetical protein